MSEIKAIIMKPDDNVCTVVGVAEAGTTIRCGIGDTHYSVTLLDHIPFAHKFALVDIEQGSPIRKYGEIIGRATCQIKAGQHVHVHNLESCRGRGDK
jgi:altronate dehydratase small subunit